jgi:hypothetical protein
MKKIALYRLGTLLLSCIYLLGVTGMLTRGHFCGEELVRSVEALAVLSHSESAADLEKGCCAVSAFEEKESQPSQEGCCQNKTTLKKTEAGAKFLSRLVSVYALHFDCWEIERNIPRVFLTEAWLIQSEEKTSPLCRPPPLLGERYLVFSQLKLGDCA